MRVVDAANAASVVMPSKQLPGPSPYIGTKWSKPHAPSKPRSSPKRTRLTMSSNSMRCWATSIPNRIPYLLEDAGVRLSAPGTFKMSAGDVQGET